MVQLAGHHPDRQRQVPAQAGDLSDRRIVRAQPGPARQPDQQRGGLPSRQGVQADRRGVLQRGQMQTAGDQHQAAARAGQQGPDLLAAGRVIQHQQQLLFGQPVPPQRHPRLQARRDLRRGDPGRQEQAGQRIGRVDGLLPGGMPVQREEDLPAGKPVRQPVRGMHGERGLAHPGHPTDRVDAYHTARTRRGLHQLLEFLLPPGERGDVTGKRPHRRRRVGDRSSRHRPTPRDRFELRPGLAGQAECVGQQPDRLPARRGSDAPLQVADRPRAQGRGLSQLLLSQPGLGAQFPQQTGEGNRRLGHRLSPRPQTKPSTPSIRRHV